MNTLISVVAFIAFVFGIISLVTPIPGGTFIVAMSLATLICVNEKVQWCVRHFRSKSKVINKFFYFMQNKVGAKIKFVGVALQKTIPEGG